MKKATQKQFKVIVERDEDGLYVASVPSLPGCHTQGKNLQELTENVRDAITLCLSVAKTDRNYRARIKESAYEPTFIGIETITI